MAPLPLVLASASSRRINDLEMVRTLNDAIRNCSAKPHDSISLQMILHVVTLSSSHLCQ